MKKKNRKARLALLADYEKRLDGLEAKTSKLMESLAAGQLPQGQVIKVIMENHALLGHQFSEMKHYVTVELKRALTVTDKLVVLNETMNDVASNVYVLAQEVRKRKLK